MSAITTPSRWAFKSKDESQISFQEILALVKVGFKNGVKSIKKEDPVVYLNLTYSCKKEKVRERFGNAPVAVVKLTDDQSFEDVEAVEALKDKFGIKALSPSDFDSSPKSSKKKSSSSKAKGQPKMKKRKIEVEEQSSEDESDNNYFKNNNRD
jgi:PleD family two-component response regulator